MGREKKLKVDDLLQTESELLRRIASEIPNGVDPEGGAHSSTHSGHRASGGGHRASNHGMTSHSSSTIEKSPTKASAAY